MNGICYELLWILSWIHIKLTSYHIYSSHTMIITDYIFFHFHLRSLSLQAFQCASTENIPFNWYASSKLINYTNEYLCQCVYSDYLRIVCPLSTWPVTWIRWTHNFHSLTLNVFHLFAVFVFILHNMLVKIFILPMAAYCAKCQKWRKPTIPIEQNTISHFFLNENSW